MVKQKPLIKLRFIPSKPDKVLGRILPEFRRRLEQEIKKFEKSSKEAVIERIPSRTGATRRSVKSKLAMNKTNLGANIVITGNQVLRFLDRGTKRSPGRYIPVLGRRLITDRADKGFHPGIRGLNIINEAKNDIEMQAKDRITALKRAMKFSVRSSFR